MDWLRLRLARLELDQRVTRERDSLRRPAALAYQPETGLYYDHDSGYYWDPGRQMYYDGTSGYYLRSVRLRGGWCLFHGNASSRCLAQELEEGEIEDDAEAEEGTGAASRAVLEYWTAERMRRARPTSPPDYSAYGSGPRSPQAVRDPPWLRMIVTETQVDGLRVGSLHVATMDGLTVGRDPSQQRQAQLSAEAAAHGDVLQEDFPDHYNNLTIKTVFMLKWLTHRCPSVPFVLKADDDMWVDMPALLQYLRDCRLPGGACADDAALMAGLLYHQAPTDRTPGSKWYLPPALRAEEPLPDYISGTAYLLTGSAVAPLWWRALETPFINLEDVFLSGLVAPRAGVRLQRAPGFEKTRPLWQHPCTCRHHLTVHGLAPAVIERLYRERRRPCGGLLWSLVNLVMIWVT
ncbi:lactosylceramide 1,3-N-acetyl-beta-D-glucosaminyltransferase-like [Pollicipes pollicipes]|uniref:lactosylceramide 1,3-N-acetyl-beta-D-glucosaminyltransferase-like n=1 Tax=Pollicipes pollicipes TaxID=41117 RepID=UPI001884C7F7|nr:lactosylceramide 1,3-N-acetyl-beta-D-glucosaminyltransferase-like [Pollicipes pollicipes]